MNIWTLLSYLGVLAKLLTIFGLLKSVKATDPTTTPESYAVIAQSLLGDGINPGDPGTQAFMENLTPEWKAKFQEGLPVFAFWLDWKVERF